MDELVFLKYPSLKNFESVDFSRIPTEILEQEWYSTEKIHGANMSIVADKKNICVWQTQRLFEIG